MKNEENKAIQGIKFAEFIIWSVIAGCVCALTALKGVRVLGKMD